MKDTFLSPYDSLLFDTLANSSDDTFFFSSNMKNNSSRWSRGAVKYFNLDSEILKPADSLWAKHIHPEDLRTFIDDMNNMIKNHSHYHNCEYRIMTNTGKYEWINCRGYMTYDEDGTPDYFAGFVYKMGSRNKIDSVTNLRTLFEFRNDLQGFLDKGENGSILMFKVMDFKHIIDEYGYKFGDKTLYEIGASLSKMIGKRAQIYRMDGVTFSIIVPTCQDNCIHNAESAIKKSLDSLQVGQTRIRLSISLAATLFPKDGNSVDRLQQNLYYALEEAKKFPSIVFYTEELFFQKSRRIKLKESLQRSIGENFEGFQVFFQPIIEASSGKCISAEALLRWSNDLFPHAGPMDFIPILESTGDIISVGKWVIDQCLKTLADWRQQKDPSNHLQHVHINVSYIQFKEPGFKDYVIAKLNSYGLPHNCLVLELTESCRIEYSDQLSILFKSFKDEGVSIALDDFGTGYASLMLLCDLPADILKLDYSMTRNFVENPQHRILLNLITNFCKEAKMELCAEGVETEESLKVMASAGANLIQGFYYSKPIPIADFRQKYIS